MESPNELVRKRDVFIDKLSEVVSELKKQKRTQILEVLQDDVPRFDEVVKRKMDNGQWTMDNGQWTMDNGQWTMAKSFFIVHCSLI